jgi:hypothetical protein
MLAGRGPQALLGDAVLGATVVSRTSTRAGTQATRHQSLKLHLSDLPLTIETLEKSTVDAGALANTFRTNPEVVLAALSDFQRGRPDRATAALGEIGLSIDELRNRGGGPWGLVILAAAAMLLLLPSQIADDEPVEGPVEVAPETMTRLKDLGIVAGEQ